MMPSYMSPPFPEKRKKGNWKTKSQDYGDTLKLFASLFDHHLSQKYAELQKAITTRVFATSETVPVAVNISS